MSKFPLEEPKPGAEADRNKRDRTDELPAKAVPNKKALKEVNNTANQTIDDGSKEVQGKLAVPHEKIMKRGQTMWTDDEGHLHKELNDAEPNARIGEEETPEYLKLHQEVLDGADPIEATLKYQNKEEDDFSEGALPEAELHPRTHVLAGEK